MVFPQLNRQIARQKPLKKAEVQDFFQLLDSFYQQMIDIFWQC